MKKTVLFLFCVGIISLSLYAAPSKESTVPLRVGIMPAVDSLPFLLARDEGLFEREGVQVELVMFSNHQERDAALQAGRLDGAISDMVAAAFFVAGGSDFRITSLTNSRFGIIGSPGLGIQSLEDLRGKRIALVVNSIIMYTVDTQMQAAGISMAEYEPLVVPLIPLRLEMVMEGQIEAAALPDPLLTAAVAQGATLLSTTDETDIYTALLLFSQKTLDTRLDDVQAFYRAYYAAAQRINADPDAYRDYMVEQAGFPATVRDSFRFVTYRRPALPEASHIMQFLDWMSQRGLLDTDLDPEDFIDRRAISEW